MKSGTQQKYNPTESQVLKAVLYRLKLHPEVAWFARMNSGGCTDNRGQFVRFGFTGCPDILGQLKDGRFLALEVKRPGGKPTKAQSEFLRKVCLNHGVGLIIDDITQIPDYFSPLGQLNEKLY